MYLAFFVLSDDLTLVHPISWKSLTLKVQSGLSAPCLHTVRELGESVQFSFILVIGDFK